MAAAARSVTRIVSYNIHACIGTDRIFDPARIADVLQALQPDYVALQEVEDRQFRDSTVSEFLAARLGMSAYSGSTLKRSDAPYGNLLLARRPAARIRTHDLSVPGGEPRGAIEARFDHDSARIGIFATHLGLRAAERAQQVQRLLALVQGSEADIAVLAGDINEWHPRSRALRALADYFDFRSTARTFPAKTPVLALDRVFVSPAGLVRRIRTARTNDSRRASDHLPLVCDLDALTPGSGRTVNRLPDPP